MSHVLSNPVPFFRFTFIKVAATKLVASIKAKRTTRKAYYELSRLTDRELCDIGLTRGDIRAVAQGQIDRDLKRNVPEINPNLKGWS